AGSAFSVLDVVNSRGRRTGGMRTLLPLLIPRGLHGAASGGRMANYVYQDDLPGGHDLGPEVPVVFGTMVLNSNRDRLCVVLLSGGDGNAHLVQVRAAAAPNLVRLLGDPQRLKLFHFGRFDIAVLLHRFGVLTGPVYCTKIASRLVRTYTDRHGLKD